MLVFTGASQFAFVGVIATGGSAAAAVGSGLLLAARNGVYGLALAPVLQGPLGCRLLAHGFVIDESTAMATAQKPDRPAGVLVVGPVDLRLLEPRHRDRRPSAAH